MSKFKVLLLLKIANDIYCKLKNIYSCFLDAKENTEIYYEKKLN